MYSREIILNFYTKRQIASQERVEYAKKNLESNHGVFKISLFDSLKELEEINFAINLLNGNDIDLLDSYLSMADI